MFNKSGKFLKPTLYYKGKKINCVQNYKYPGIIFQSSGVFTMARKDLAQRASKAVFKLIKSFNNTPPKITTCLHLFDHTVKPILLYGSEIWGSFLIDSNKELYHKWLQDEIEKCHQHFLRYLLHVNRRTPKMAIYSETGRLPLLNEILCNVLKYWLRIRTLAESTLLHNAYVSNVQMHPNINCTTVIETLSHKLCLNREDTLLTKAKFIQKLKYLLKEQFINKWKQDLFDDKRNKNFGNKLRTYRLFKTNFRMEQYLFDVRSQKAKGKLTQLRVGSHNLYIETGRHSVPYKDPSERICRYCHLNEVEDEFHFVMKCTLYEPCRDKLFERISTLYPVFNTYNCKLKFIWLLANLDAAALNTFAHFVHDCFEKRSSVEV